MKVLPYAVAANGNRAVIDDGIPEKSGSIGPGFIPTHFSYPFVADHFRYLRIGMHAREQIFSLQKQSQNAAMRKALRQLQVPLITGYVCYIGKLMQRDRSRA
jgi:hypothetical protein